MRFGRPGDNLRNHCIPRFRYGGPAVINHGPDAHSAMSQPESRVEKKNITGRRSSLLKILILGLFLFGIFVFFALDLGRHLTLSSLKENRDALSAYTQTHYGSTVFLYVLIYGVQTAFSFPGATILTLAGGFLFGTLLGTLYVNFGATGGAVLAFLGARYLFREAVERKFGERLNAILRGFSKNGFYYLLTLRLIPLFPFFLVNLAAGLTRIRLAPYAAATSIGIIPGSFVYANAGKQLGTLESPSDIASPGVLGAFVLLGLLALLPVVYQKLKRNSAAPSIPPVH